MNKRGVCTLGLGRRFDGVQDDVDQSLFQSGFVTYNRQLIVARIVGKFYSKMFGLRCHKGDNVGDHLVDRDRGVRLIFDATKR